MKKIDFATLKEKLEKEEINLLEVFSRETPTDTKEERYSNVPIDEVGKEAEARFDKRETIVVYSTDHDQQASEEAARKLEEMGFTNVFHYTGTPQEWDELGFPRK